MGVVRRPALPEMWQRAAARDFPGAGAPSATGATLLRRPRRLPLGGRAQPRPDRPVGALSRAAVHHAAELSAGADPAAVLDRIRLKAPGFPAARYEQELAAAQAWIETRREQARRHRAELVEAARDEDVLNAVFALRCFNRRHADRASDYGVGRIDIHEALGDLFSAEEIAAATDRSDALVDDGRRAGHDTWDRHRQIRELAEAHPGFTQANLGEALD